MADIAYHEQRRGSRMIPLLSYSDQPAESTLNGLDFFDFHLNDVYDCILIAFIFYILFSRFSMLFQRSTLHIIAKYSKVQVILQKDMPSL